MPIFILLVSVVALLPLTNHFSLFTGKASAAASSTLNFQGRLLTNTGGMVPDGSYNIEFKIYDDATVGSNLWTENRTGGSSVTVRNGYFSVYLGDVIPFGASIPWDQELWMTMNVNGDGEMSPRFKLTAVPYAFRAGAVTDAAGNAFTGDDLIQKSPSTIQTVNSALAAIRLNQAGSGTLLQLQGNGVDVFTLDKSGNVSTSGGVTLGNNTGTVAGTIRWTGTDFEGYDGLSWVSLTSGGGGGGGGGAANTSMTFISGHTNLAANTTVQLGVLNQTSATAVSWTAGTNTGFVAPADGSFRSCLVNNTAAITGGEARIRWRVNGATVGSQACVMTTANPRFGASSIDPGIVTFSAGDVISIAIESVALAPTTIEFTVYWSVEYNSSAVISSDAFVQDGNAFGGTATLGTTDNFGLQIITNNTAALSITSGGDATFAQSLTVQNGGIDITGNSTITGTLDGITGLTVVSGGASVTGGIDNNNGGITESGAISGVDGSISSLAGLTITSASGGDITLDSASGIVSLTGSTLRRIASGTTLLELNDTSDTTFSITNTNGLAVANLNVEGSVSGLSFSGSGSSLTGLNADNITSGTLNDSRLSTNVALLNTAQTLTGLNTFSSGLVVGNTGSATTGAIRFTGSDFEGYDGSQWLSLTSGGGGGGSNVTTVIKPANETINNTITLQPDDDLVFPIGANEVWSFRFAVQASAVAAADLRFAVTAPSGAVCQVAFAESENAASDAQKGCGATSTVMNSTGTPEFYEISGTVTNGVNAGNVTLEWAQFTLNASNAIVYGGSYVNAYPESIYIAPPSSVFVQGGNTFGATAVIGTGDTNGLQIITDGVARLSFASTGEATFSSGVILNSTLDVAGTTILSGDVTLGDNSTDGLTIVGSNVALTNGLNFDGNTFVIDSASDFIGINNGTPTNRLTINTASAVDSAAQGFIATGGVGNKGLVIQGVGSQTANLFELQDNSGNTLAGFNSSGDLVLGLSTLSSTATVSRNIALPDASGTICLSSSSLCGYIQFAQGSFQTDATLSDSIAINKTGASGNLLALQKNGGAVFTVANTGSLQIQSTDSAALDIRNVGGTSFFSVDTSSGIVRVGPSTADGNGVLFVLDTKNTAGDPTGADGGIYYNSSLGKFRCFEEGVWLDCIGTKQIRSFVDNTADAVVDANTTNYWDTAAENNNSHPNITPSSTTRSVYGSLSVQVTSTTGQDRSVVTRVERGIGSVPTCGSGTVVGFYASTFTTNIGEIVTASITFLDTPATTSQVFYAVCSDANTSSAAGVTIDKIRITLEEATNTN